METWRCTACYTGWDPWMSEYLHLSRLRKVNFKTPVESWSRGSVIGRKMVWVLPHRDLLCLVLCLEQAQQSRLLPVLPEREWSFLFLSYSKLAQPLTVEKGIQPKQLINKQKCLTFLPDVILGWRHAFYISSDVYFSKYLLFFINNDGPYSFTL